MLNISNTMIMYSTHYCVYVHKHWCVQECHGAHGFDVRGWNPRIVVSFHPKGHSQVQDAPRRIPKGSQVQEDIPKGHSQVPKGHSQVQEDIPKGSQGLLPVFRLHKCAVLTCIFSWRTSYPFS